ncbi:MAG: hypothetical protein ACRECN_06345, partial [Methylocella sp.]
GENNVRLYTADGTLAGAFAMGDGIAYVRCAADATIWVGYFDEGVFNGPNKDGNWPVSSSGIAHFGPDGKVLWRFNDEQTDDLFISESYALALKGITLGCCPYTDFPIVRLGRVPIASVTAGLIHPPREGANHGRAILVERYAVGGDRAAVAALGWQAAGR